MKKIFNIFQKSCHKTPKPASPIIIDTREKNSLVTANLIEKQAKIKFETLEIADYIVGETAIERKTFSDFASSIINKRLTTQLKELKKYKKYFLIIEGFDFNYEKILHKNAIKGMILSIILNYNVPIIFTENEEDTAEFLIILKNQQEKNKILPSTRQSKTFKSIEEQKQFILEGFPGIGPTIAKKLLEKYKTLENIFSATESELKEIKKFDEKKIQKFKELIEK